MPIRGVYHVNINVRDMDRAVDFYRRLGFSIRGPASFDGPKSAAIGLRIKGGRGRVATATIASNPAIPVLDIIEWQEPATEGDAYPHLHHTGINRIAFLAENIWGTYRQLKAAGIEFWSEPQGLRTGAGTTLYCCFSDPDGTVLELIEHISPDDEE